MTASLTLFAVDMHDDAFFIACTPDALLRLVFIADDDATGGCEGTAKTNLALSDDDGGRQHPINLFSAVTTAEVAADKEIDVLPTYSESALPPGWETGTDDWGRVFYIDHNRGVTQWESPVPDVLGDQDTGINREQSTAFAPASVPVCMSTNGNAPPAYPSQHSSTAVFPTTCVPTQAQSAPSHVHPLGPSDDGADVFDWSVLTQDQLDNVPCIKLNVSNTVKGFGLWASFVDTMFRNMCFFTFSVVMWIMLVLGISLGVAASQASESAYLYDNYVGVYVACGFYGVWTLCITMRVGCMCGWIEWCACYKCCGCCSSGCCVNDKPLEALSTPTAEDMTGFRRYYAELRSGEPIITLHVQCSHIRTTGFGKRRRHRTVITYSNSRRVALERWKDVSVPPDVLEQAIRQHAPGNVCISYTCKYQVHPNQSYLIAALQKQYYEENKHRDHTTITTVTYTSRGYRKGHVDVVVAQRGTWRYRLFCVCCNWFTFYLSVWTTLYFFYIVVWKYFQRPVHLTIVKYIHLADRILPDQGYRPLV